jgi:hypothetical protein
MTDAALCPRCAAAFDCGAAGPGPCACARLALSDTLRQDLRQRYTGCLCPACLQALGAQPRAAAGPAGSSPVPADR